MASKAASATGGFFSSLRFTLYLGRATERYQGRKGGGHFHAVLSCGVHGTQLVCAVPCELFMQRNEIVRSVKRVVMQMHFQCQHTCASQS